ncbi:cation acetate symporter [Dehalococcoidales bacterium]|nr:cation acetate symporter [Dehalococcoidales bacterium]
MENPISVGIVAAFLVVFLLLGYIARKTAATTDQFFVAGGRVSWIANGLAQLGNYCSAASFLGIAGAIALVGIDGWWIGLGFLASWIFLLLVIAAPLKNTGKYTVADVMTARFGWSKGIKTWGMLVTVTIGVLYLVPQIVGAGWLFEMLLGWDYAITIIITGVVMALIVVFGGMLGTTWNQVLQGVMLWSALVVILIAAGIVYFGGNPLAIMDRAIKAVPPHVINADADGEYLVEAVATAAEIDHSAAVQTARELRPAAEGGLSPGVMVPDIWNQLSLWLGLLLGVAGLPHILTRFYTVRNARVAQKSTELTIWSLATFYIACIFVGLAMMYVLYPVLVELLAAGERGMATNMALAILGERIWGQVGLGIVAAGAMAAMIGTSIGLLISSTTSLAHDFWGGILRPESSERERVLVTKIATVIFTVLAVLLAWWLRHENVAVLVGLCFGIAGSTFALALIACMWWDRLTKQGVVWGMAVGLISSLIFTFARFFELPSLLGIPVLVNPALYSVPLGLLAMVIVSYRTKETGKVEEFMALAHR